MADTTPLAPTDDEIAALYTEQTGFILDDSPAALLDFARAVLAKWGTPHTGATLGPDAIYELIHGFGHTTHAQSMEIALGIADLSPPSTTTQPAPVQSGLVATMLDALRHAQKVLNHNNLHLACGPVNAAILAARAPAAESAQGDALDAARLDWLALAGPVQICLVIDRDFDGEIEVATEGATGYGRTLRAAIDAARAAQEGKSHDN